MGKKKVSIWDKIDDDLTISRKLEREGACGVDHWIISNPDGERIIRPYHCGSCDDCKHREAIELQSRIYSLAYLEENDIRVIKAPPNVISMFVKEIDTDDYARFPSTDGFDYLISSGGKGKSVFDADIDWDKLVDRRPKTRKSGKLFTYKKPDKPEQTIPLKDIRASSYEDALIAVNSAIDFFDGEDYDKEINDETELVMKNNMLSAHIIGALDDKGKLIFEHTVKRGYALPVKFKPILSDYAKGDNEE